MAPVEDEDDDVVILLLEGKTRKLFVRLNSSSFNEGDLVLWRKGDQHITISPLVNTDRKGGAYRIMLQQFRRAIAVTAANGHSQHILQRLHYVRGTEQEARDACRSHHSDNRWRPYQRGGYSWFNSHVSEGYAMFEQFRNGYYYHMP